MATPTQKRLNRTVEEINPLLDKLDEDYTKEQIDEKFSAIAGGIHYKGEVNYYSDLPNDAEGGDAYTVKYAGSSGSTLDGSEYVWGAVSGVYQWIDFSKDTYTKAEVTALLALKQDTIDSAHKLSSDLVDDTNNTHKFATAAQLEQIKTNKNNISKQQDTIADGGNGYAIVNGIRVYVSSTAPTGDIPDGSIWIGG